MRTPPLVAAIALGSIACGGSVMSVPKTAAPVLLGPVDRIGGHVAGPAPADAPTVRSTSSTGFSLTSVGPYLMVSRYDEGTRPTVTAVFDATTATSESDVHVTSLKSGGSASVIGAHISWDDQGELRGTVSKVTR